MSSEQNRVIWPLGLAAREGVATARHGRWTSLLVIVAIAACIAVPGAADSVAVSKLIADEQAWIAAGGHVFVVTGARIADRANPVAAVACDRLTQLDGVVAAFAMLPDSGRGAFSHIPGGRVPVYTASPGVTRFLGAASTAGAPVIVTAGLASRTGVHNGEVVHVQGYNGLVATATSAPLTVRIADSTVLGEEYDGALLMPTLLTGDADSCFVRTDSAHYSAIQAALPALLAHEGQPAIAQPRLFSSQFTVDYTHAFEDRAFHWLWVAAASLLLLIWVITQWFRRSQLAIYATFGMRAASRQVMQVSEWAVLAAFGLPWGWGLGVVWALALGASPETAVLQVSSHAMLTILAATVAVVVVGLRPTGSLLDALKDRN